MSTRTAAAAAAVPEKPAHLDPSELGTKEYWDNLYKTEITNHAHNPSDEGTVWFDDSDAQTKMVEFLDEFAESGIDKASATVIDLGCGNGSMLFALREEGWEGRLLGVDYSEQSVAFAKQVQLGRSKDEDNQWEDVEFRTWDVLNGGVEELGGETITRTTRSKEWDVVLDKGTFDAISLSEEVRGHDGRPISEGYGERVLGLMKEGGIFLVTSCNWTEGELKAWFEADEYRVVAGDNRGGERMRLRQVGRVEYPSFSFGGVKGSTISTLCFVKEVV